MMSSQLFSTPHLLDVHRLWHFAYWKEKSRRGRNIACALIYFRPKIQCHIPVCQSLFDFLHIERRNEGAMTPDSVHILGSSAIPSILENEPIF